MGGSCAVVRRPAWGWPARESSPSQHKSSPPLRPGIAMPRFGGPQKQYKRSNPLSAPRAGAEAVRPDLENGPGSGRTAREARQTGPAHREVGSTAGLCQAPGSTLAMADLRAHAALLTTQLATTFTRLFDSHEATPATLRPTCVILSPVDCSRTHATRTRWGHSRYYTRALRDRQAARRPTSPKGAVRSTPRTGPAGSGGAGPRARSACARSNARPTRGCGE